MDCKSQIPIIDLSAEMERGSQQWDYVCKRVKEACENYGCFEVAYDRISKQLRAEIFSLIRQLFLLPMETKEKNCNSKPYHGYAAPNPKAPLYEGFGFEDVSNHNSLQGFADQLWTNPLAHDHFCEMFSSMMKAVDELQHTIGKLIIDSYGLGDKKMDSIFPCKTLLRVMKYKSPSPEDDDLGLFANTDKPLCTLLGEDDISGLEVETKNGQWIKLFPSPNSFVFIVGDPLMAWSNGRLHAVKHRVKISGEKDRYSLGVFLVPVEGTIIKPQKELIDENHPQILKEFDFMEFMTFTSSTAGMAMDSANQVFAFAGI